MLFFMGLDAWYDRGQQFSSETIPNDGATELKVVGNRPFFLLRDSCWCVRY